MMFGAPTLGSFILWNLNTVSALLLDMGQIHGLFLEHGGGPIDDARVDIINNSLTSFSVLGNCAFLLMASYH